MKSKENITRGYTYMLPLPREIPEDIRETVQELGEVWVDIFRRKLHLHQKDEAADRVNTFIDNLPEDQIFWLEGRDHKHKKTRIIMIKERAMQYQQMRETPASKRRNPLPQLDNLFSPTIKMTQPAEDGNNDKIVPDD